MGRDCSKRVNTGQTGQQQVKTGENCQPQNKLQQTTTTKNNNNNTTGSTAQSSPKGQTDNATDTWQ